MGEIAVPGSNKIHILKFFFSSNDCLLAARKKERCRINITPNDFGSQTHLHVQYVDEILHATRLYENGSI